MAGTPATGAAAATAASNPTASLFDVQHELDVSYLARVQVPPVHPSKIQFIPDDKAMGPDDVDAIELFTAIGPGLTHRAAQRVQEHLNALGVVVEWQPDACGVPRLHEDVHDRLARLLADDRVLLNWKDLVVSALLRVDIKLNPPPVRAATDVVRPPPPPPPPRPPEVASDGSIVVYVDAIVDRGQCLVAFTPPLTSPSPEAEQPPANPLVMPPVDDDAFQPDAQPLADVLYRLIVQRRLVRAHASRQDGGRARH